MIEELQRMIDESNNIVFFGGAGVSTESGIKDFRSKDGIYSETHKYPPEYMLSHEMFLLHQEEFFKFYKETFNLKDIKPNITHKYLKKLEDKGKLKLIVTQNIDGLHEAAGNKNIALLHGTIYKNHCLRCNREYSSEYVFNSIGIPKCECGEVIKPDVVLYGESLPEKDFSMAIKKISEANMLIVAGTSLTVEPASSLVNLFKGKYLVIINRDKTKYDYKADLVIHDSLKNVFSKLK